VQVPFVLVIYLPYLILGGFFDMIGSGYYYYDYSIAWFIGALALIFISSIVWAVITLLILKKTKKKFIRVMLYLTQFPAIWFLSMILSLLIAVPFGFLAAFLSQDFEIVPILDGFCCMSIVTALLPVMFYRILWKRRKKK
jgi:hypothetical protein